MASRISLAAGNNWECFRNQSDNGSSFVNCSVTKEPSHTAGSKVAEARPDYCEIPGMAHYHALKGCSYTESGGMKRCGCPTLDHQKNPELWNDYRDSVSTFLGNNLSQGEITLTFFGSGLFLGDFHLLDHLFSEGSLKGWPGKVNLQFVDTRYQVKPIDDTAQTGSELKLIAIAATVIGAGTIYAGSQQAKKEHAYTLYTIGAISWIIAILALWSSFPKPEVQMEDHEVNTAAKSLLNNLKEKLNRDLEISFFSNNTDCETNGKVSDVILGYDIGNGKGDFLKLRQSILKEAGASIHVTKIPSASPKFQTPVITMGQGKHFAGDIEKKFPDVSIV